MAAAAAGFDEPGQETQHANESKRGGLYVRTKNTDAVEQKERSRAYKVYIGKRRLLSARPHRRAREPRVYCGSTTFRLLLQHPGDRQSVRLTPSRQGPGIQSSSSSSWALCAACIPRQIGIWATERQSCRGTGSV